MEISQQSVDQMVDAVMTWKKGARIQVLAPVVRGRKGEYTKLIQDARKTAISNWIDGEVMEIEG